MSTAHSKREEELLSSIQKVLEANHWDGQKAQTTHSLKELLISKFVEVEATSNMNITALIALTTEPSEIVDNFEKLVKFCVECPSVSRSEVTQVVYPVFVHIYIYLVSQKWQQHAKIMSDRFSSSFDSTQQSELSELFAFPSAKELLSSELANKYREKKYCVRMSDRAFHLLVQFLQVLRTPFLLTLIQRYLAIEVYGNTSMTPLETSKPEPKKTAPFIKPRVSRLDENRLQVKMKSPGSGFVLASSSTPSSSSSSSGPARSGHAFPPRVTSAAQLAGIGNFKEALAAAEQVDPTTPSVAVYTVHSTDNNVHCASYCTAAKHYACGFADSSIHVWSQLPGTETPNPTTCHMTRTQPMGWPSDSHRRLVGHSGPVYGTCFDASGEFLLSSSEDCSVQLWSLEKQASVVSYKGHAYPVWDVSFSPLGIHFASASMDQSARMWTTDLTYPLRVFAAHTSGVNAVRFHPNGQYVATGSHDRTCRLWDTQSGRCVRLMPCNKAKSSITSIAFSPNGKQLVGGGLDGVARVWDLGSGNLLKEYPPPSQSTSRGQVSALAFSSDSSLLACSSHLNCINVYNMKSLVDEPLLSLSVPPKTCSVLQLQFSHRNCLIAIAKLENSFSPQDLDNSTFN